MTDVEMLTTPQVGRRLGISASEVYRLIFDGDLEGGPDEAGTVKVSVRAVERYVNAHPATSSR